MKKISALLVMLMSLSLVACGTKIPTTSHVTSDPTSSSTTTQVETTPDTTVTTPNGGDGDQGGEGEPGGNPGGEGESGGETEGGGTEGGGTEGGGGQEGGGTEGGGESGGEGGGEEIVTPTIDPAASETKAVYDEASMSGYTGTYEEWVAAANEKELEIYNIYITNHPEYTGDINQWFLDLVDKKIPALKVCTVTFDSLEGEAIAPIKVLEGQKIKERPLDPYLAGKEFDEWYVGEEVFDFDSVITDDVNLLAHYYDQNSGNWDTSAITIILGKNKIKTTKSNTSIWFKYDSDEFGYLVFPDYKNIRDVKCSRLFDYHFINCSIETPLVGTEECKVYKRYTYYFEYYVGDNPTGEIEFEMIRTTKLHDYEMGEGFGTFKYESPDGTANKIKPHAFVKMNVNVANAMYSIQLFDNSYYDYHEVIKFLTWDKYIMEYIERDFGQPDVLDETYLYHFPRTGEFYVDVTADAYFNLNIKNYSYTDIQPIDISKEYTIGANSGTLSFKFNVDADGIYEIYNRDEYIGTEIYRINSLKDEVTDKNLIRHYQKVNKTGYGYILYPGVDYALRLWNNHKTEQRHFEIRPITNWKIADPYASGYLKPNLYKLFAYEPTESSISYVNNEFDMWAFDITEAGKYSPIEGYNLNNFKVYKFLKGHKYGLMFINTYSQKEYLYLKDFDMEYMPHSYCSEGGNVVIGVTDTSDVIKELSFSEKQNPKYIEVNVPVLNNFELYIATGSGADMTFAKQEPYSIDEKYNSVVYEIDITNHYFYRYVSHLNRSDLTPQPYYINIESIVDLNKGYHVIDNIYDNEGYGSIHNFTLSTGYKKTNEYETKIVRFMFHEDGVFTVDHSSYHKGNHTSYMIDEILLNDNEKNYMYTNSYDGETDYGSKLGSAKITVKAGDIVTFRVLNQYPNEDIFNVEFTNLVFTPATPIE